MVPTKRSLNCSGSPALSPTLRGISRDPPRPPRIEDREPQPVTPWSELRGGDSLRIGSRDLECLVCLEDYALILQDEEVVGRWRLDRDWRGVDEHNLFERGRFITADAVGGHGNGKFDRVGRLGKQIRGRQAGASAGLRDRFAARAGGQPRAFDGDADLVGLAVVVLRRCFYSKLPRVRQLTLDTFEDTLRSSDGFEEISAGDARHHRQSLTEI